MRYLRHLIAAASGLALLAASAAAQTGGLALANRGGLLYVTHVPLETAASPDFAGQIQLVLADLDRHLKISGSGIDRVVAATVYLKNASDFPALNEAWARTWPKDPPTRTTIVAGLPLPQALVRVSAIAVPAGAERVVIHPAGWAKPAGPYSYAIKTGDTVFLSGLVPRNPRDNSLVSGDIIVQTRAVLDNARTILEAAGLAPADVVNARIYITDAANFQAMNGAYRPFFPVNPPTRATVRSALISPNDLVEITLTAAAGAERHVFTTPTADGKPGQPNANLSSAIAVGSHLYLSGMLGMLPGNAGNLASQTEETLDRLQRTMTLAGYSWSNVGEAVIYLKDATKADVVRDAMLSRTWALPVATFVESGLMSPDGLVEILLTAGK